MGLPRFRIRALLILVTLTGVGTGAYVLWRRSSALHRLEGVYRSLEEGEDESITRNSEKLAVVIQNHGAPEYRGTIESYYPSSDPDYYRGAIERAKKLRAIYRATRLRYAHAARLPWLRVPSDLPVPE